MLRKLGLIALMIGFIALLALPLATQAKDPDPASLTIVSGPVDLSNGSIMVGSNIIAPASAFSPSILHQGDVVIVTGYLLPDGVTIQAVSLEFFDDSQPPTDATEEPTAEVTTEPTAEVTVEPTAEVTVEPTAEVTSEPTAEATSEVNNTGACTNPGQPVAQRMADAFGVSYDEIMSWRCQGFGFGEIARAYLLADADGVNGPDFYFNEKSSGLGWGQIVKQAGVKPSDLAPGHVIHHGQADNTSDTGNGHGNNGNGNGNGNGHGNNGNGNGHGNGNGNGNGKGNGHGNGNSGG